MYAWLLKTYWKSTAQVKRIIYWYQKHDKSITIDEIVVFIIKFESEKSSTKGTKWRILPLTPNFYTEEKRPEQMGQTLNK